MIDEADEWEFFAEKRRKARKEHKCCECRRTIFPGETYNYYIGKMYKDFSEFKMCAHCSKAAGWLATVCHGYLFNCVEEDLFEHITGDEWDLRSTPLIRLGRWMRQDWQDSTGQLRPVSEVAAVADHALAVYKRRYARATNTPLS